MQPSKIKGSLSDKKCRRNRLMMGRIAKKVCLSLAFIVLYSISCVSHTQQQAPTQTQPGLAPSNTAWRTPPVGNWARLGVEQGTKYRNCKNTQKLFIMQKKNILGHRIMGKKKTIFFTHNFTWATRFCPIFADFWPLLCTPL